MDGVDEKDVRMVRASSQVRSGGRFNGSCKIVDS